jgi:hypothetical protein
MDPTNASIIYGGGVSTVYKTITGGSSWSNVKTSQGQRDARWGGPFVGVTAIAIDPTAPSTIYITVQAVNLAGVFKTTTGSQ